MRNFLFFLFIALGLGMRSQNINPVVAEKSLFFNLPDGDSVIVYQCHVENASTTLVTASGQTVTGTQKKSTITEKFVIKRIAGKFFYNYYTSSLSVFPNRKFSGLKIREKPYWDFKKAGDGELSTTGLNVLLAIEKKGHEAIEYDFVISQHTPNQVIMKRKKNFKQLVLETPHLISKLALNS
jgi:hypothetical protein